MSGILGRFYDTRNQWIRFDGNLPHGVEPVLDGGSRVSMVYFVPKHLQHLEDQHFIELQRLGFPCSGLRQKVHLSVADPISRQLVHEDTFFLSGYDKNPDFLENWR